MLHTSFLFNIFDELDQVNENRKKSILKFFDIFSYFRLKLEAQIFVTIKWVVEILMKFVL